MLGTTSPTQSRRLFNPRQALEYIDGGGLVGRDRFYRWLRSGRLPSIRDGARYFIAKAALDRLMEQIEKGEWPDE